MGLFDFFRSNKKQNESDVFQEAFEKTFEPLRLKFMVKARLLVSLYDAFTAGAADNGIKQAAAITGSSKEVLKPLIDRTWRLTHGRIQWQRIIETSDSLPYLMLDVTDKRYAKAVCVEMDGVARRIDDPYWETHYPPCERIDCMCKVIQLGDRQIKRLGTKVSPPDKA